MTKKIFLNGNVLPIKNASISIDDRGFLLGDGLFETIRFDQAHAPHFEQHWARLKNGAKRLGIALPFSEEAALDQILRLLRENQLENKPVCIRITVTRGSGPRGLTPPKTPTSTVMIQSVEISDKKTPSIAVTHSEVTINEHSPLRTFKSLNYAEAIIARQAAIHAGYDDALLYNTQGFLVSATAANVFLVIGDKILTPPISAGALPGIQRQHVMNQARRLRIPIEETNLRREDCDRAQAAFITNSLIQLTPIHRLENCELALPREKYNLLI